MRETGGPVRGRHSYCGRLGDLYWGGTPKGEVGGSATGEAQVLVQTGGPVLWRHSNEGDWGTGTGEAELMRKTGGPVLGRHSE
jgi:hypothetical protein